MNPDTMSLQYHAGYQRLDYAIGVLLKDMGKVLSVSYAHNVDATTAAGAEVSKRLDDKDAAAFTLGCVCKLCFSHSAYMQARFASTHDG